MSLKRGLRNQTVRDRLTEAPALGSFEESSRFNVQAFKVRCGRCASGLKKHSRFDPETEHTALKHRKYIALPAPIANIFSSLAKHSPAKECSRFKVGRAPTNFEP